MSAPFKHSAETLFGFLSQPGRGYYIPYYQRPYSWDEENAEKLLEDIFGGVKRTLTKANNSIFLGTIILHDEANVVVGTHTDTPNLVTKVSNVVDGQQRIVSVGLLACTLSHYVSKVAKDLESSPGATNEFLSLVTELENQNLDLTELYSIEIKKSGSQPTIKPLVIRAGDVTSNPVSDQWTLSGQGDKFYCSNSASFVSNFINGTPLPDIPTDDRLESVVGAFLYQFEDELKSADSNLAQQLLSANNTGGGSLANFMDYPPDLANILPLPGDEQSLYYGGMLLLAICSFLKNSCHLVVIECQDEDIAFDMFQALNATGTPLTAFEVFKPLIVRVYGTAYASTIKSQVDRIDAVLDNESTAGGKEELTDKVIGSSTLIYNGAEITRKFSEERDWLCDNFPQPASAASIEFISTIADQAVYRDKFIRPRKSPKNASSFGLADHLQSLGLNSDQADIAALCVFFLRDANHQFAHSVTSVFYSKLLDAQAAGPTAITAASKEFVSMCKATASFFTLWMGSLQGRFPDSVYRDLFQTVGANMSVLNGQSNQTENFVKDVFRKALQSENVYQNGNQANSRQLWISKSKGNPWYLRRAVCKFGLFAASHDAAPDTASGKEGLFTNGMPNSASFLNCKAWHASEYEVIEHVATRDKPNTTNYPAHFDSTVYPGNTSVVDKIGNLTQLSVQVNSSIYSEWPDKVFYYWSLTKPQNTTAGPAATALKTALGLSTVPPGLTQLSASSNYLPQLAPLAHRGIKGKKWDSTFIDERSEHLCGRIFDKLEPWLR